MKILVLNSGSSSVKFELFGVGGASEHGGRATASVAPSGRDLKSIKKGIFDGHGEPIKDYFSIVKRILHNLGLINEFAPSWRIERKRYASLRVGHRVVHGGEKYTRPVKITPAVIAEIRKLSELAPLHNSPNLECILACEKLLPGAVNVAVFDTAFHQTMPEKAFLYGLPYSYYEKFGIRRFGFHGTSHQYVFEVARKKLGAAATKRTVTVHLGNGCSATAILDGKVIDTSMGFTPLEGLPMGTRSGDIDTSIVFYLVKKGFKPAEIERVLNNESGLKGVSGISSDMRDVWAAAKRGNKKAKLALEWYCYRIAKYIGGFAAALGGLNCVVFTGGVGENAGYVRKMVMDHLAFIKDKKVLVIKTDEAKLIAEETVSSI